MSDTASFKIVHAMRVRGQVREFVRHAPVAVMQTFNKHPRMRAKQSRTEFAATICPEIALEDVAALRLLHVRDVSTAQMQDDAAWYQYAQEQTDIPFNRFDEFPFCLHVWVDAASDTARLFLFSDHYISDGASGNTILHDILAFASAQSLTAAADEPAASAPHALVTHMPVVPSFYDLLLSPYPVQSRLYRLIMKLSAKLLLTNTTAFTPLLTPRANQLDFAAPPPSNSSIMLFASGTQASLQRVLARCKRERTTFFGAAMAAVITGYAAMVRDDRTKDTATMKLFATMNFRERFVEPIDPNAVGLFAEAHDMAGLGRERVDALRSARFWDIARRAKQETVDILNNFAGMALPTVLFDQCFTNRADPAFFKGVSIPFATSGDTNVSSLGRYPHALTHTFWSADRSKAALEIESLHFSVCTPFIMPGTQFTITSVHSVGYGVSHHYEPRVGQALFDAVVNVLEHAGTIENAHTIADVIEHLVVPVERAASKSERVVGIGAVAA